MNIAALKKIFIVGVAAMAMAGCATAKIDWTARIGHYTYSQAVKEFGPPDKSTKLEDGTTVAEWMTERGKFITTPQGPYVVASRRYFGTVITPGYYSTTYLPGHYLRFTFGADGTLAAETEFDK